MYKITPLLSTNYSNKQKQDLLRLFSTFSNHSLQTKTEMSLGWLLEEETDSCAKLALLPAETGAVFVDFINGKKKPSPSVWRRQEPADGTCGGNW